MAPTKQAGEVKDAATLAAPFPGATRILRTGAQNPVKRVGGPAVDEWPELLYA